MMMMKEAEAEEAGQRPISEGDGDLLLEAVEGGRDLGLGHRKLLELLERELAVLCAVVGGGVRRSL
jgi:hypothetical protein